MILHGDSLVMLKDLKDNSIDAVVTDPPYGLKFMGKKWDFDVPSIDLWKEVIRVLKPGGHALSFGGTRTYHRLAVAIDDAGFEIRDQIQWLYGSGFPKSQNALKPANEPIVLARKPLSGATIGENIERWGTGAININDSRTESKRWPANLILDEEAAELLDKQSGILKSGAPGIKRDGNNGPAFGAESRPPGTQMGGFGDSGGASRFFYVAKASKHERGLDNNHPTVKPIKLMEYLCKLITPAGGTILDPFCGSGTTGVAAKQLGFNFIGIEQEAEYVEIANKRIENATAQEETKDLDQIEMNFG